MLMDGLNLYASMREIKFAIEDGRIDKIQQPERDELLLTIRAGGENHKLLLSASPQNAAVYLTQKKRTNPTDAPMFCMLLRKRLTGGRILSVAQPNMDRVLEITIQARNELGDVANYKLVAEVMGKHSNIILINEKNIIVEAIKHIGLGVSNIRIVIPGLEYVPAPSQDKLCPINASYEDFHDVFIGPGKADKRLSAKFFGLSPSMAMAVLSVYTDNLDCNQYSLDETAALTTNLLEFYKKLSSDKIESHIALNEYDEPIAAFPFKPKHLLTKEMPSVGDTFDALSEGTQRSDGINRIIASVRKVLQNNIERCEKKISLYNNAIDSTEDMEKVRVQGELLLSGMHSAKIDADGNAGVLDYYAEPPTYVLIPMDKRFSIADNAQKYYKKYQKMKSAKEMAVVRLKEAVVELDYLMGQMDNLSKCNLEADYFELLDELKQEGYIKKEHNGKKTHKQAPSKPLCFESSEGMQIFVGKNNRQNDELTMRVASGEDIWMHTKDIPGSHVIIKSGGNVNNQTLFEAATLAAYYSQAKNSANVPVDYTPRKYIKKPSGAKPGMVIYTTNKTAYVDPDESLVKRLKQIK